MIKKLFQQKNLSKIYNQCYTNSNGCLILIKKPINAYPTIYDKETKKNKLAHRYIYEKFYGKIPDNMEISHKCCEKRCINPSHLECTTHKENMSRSIMRLRLARNSRNGRCKLSNATVTEIRLRYLNENISMSKLAKEYNTCLANIWKIINYKTREIIFRGIE